MPVVRDLPATLHNPAPDYVPKAQRATFRGFLRELAKNPLIVSTAAGLLCNLLGIRLPELVSTTLGRIGAAALPLGLMAVGAGLTFGGL